MQRTLCHASTYHSALQQARFHGMAAEGAARSLVFMLGGGLPGMSDADVAQYAAVYGRAAFHEAALCRLYGKLAQLLPRHPRAVYARLRAMGLSE